MLKCMVMTGEKCQAAANRCDICHKCCQFVTEVSHLAMYIHSCIKYIYLYKIYTLKLSKYTTIQKFAVCKIFLIQVYF